MKTKVTYYKVITKKKLKELGIPDSKTMRENAVDDVTKWLQVTLGSIFLYLKKKDFDADYIGEYKDKKAFLISTVVSLDR